MIKFFFKVFFFFSISFSNCISKNFIDKGHYIIDLKNRVEWLKCSIGQQWDGETCIGEPVKVTLNKAKELRLQAGEELGGKWRLPVKKELISLICMECPSVKIDLDIFPKTPSGIFWSSSRNWWSPKFFWSVNFYTGHSYGRFVPQKELFVRFLRDR